MDSQPFESGPRQVQVQFTTNFPDIELPEGKRQLLVPTGKSTAQANPLN
jgi:ribosome biogenesis protein YTM1